MSKPKKPYYETKSFKAATIGVMIVAAPFAVVSKTKTAVIKKLH